MSQFIWNYLKKFRKPRIADLPPEQQMRARIMMWGAGADLRPASGDTTIKVEIKMPCKSGEQGSE